MSDEVLELVVPKPLYMNRSRMMLNAGVDITSNFANGTCSVEKKFTTKSKTWVLIIGYSSVTDTYSITLEMFSHVLDTEEEHGQLIFHASRSIVDEHHTHAKK